MGASWWMVFPFYLVLMLISPVFNAAFLSSISRRLLLGIVMASLLIGWIPTIPGFSCAKMMCVPGFQGNGILLMMATYFIGRLIKEYDLSKKGRWEIWCACFVGCIFILEMVSMKVKSYEELLAWHKAMLLAEMVYVIQKQLPKEEVYGLGDQIGRVVVSVPSNIAEGFGRETDKDFKHFLSIARVSLYETKTQLELAESLGFFRMPSELIELFSEVAKLINGLSRNLLTNDQRLATND